MYNTKVFSSNGKIICNDTELDDYIIDVAGFNDSEAELITSDIIKGTQYLKCESIEITVSKGDLIRVFSNKEFSTEEGVKQGEIQKVDDVIIETVGGIDYYSLKIYGCFEDTYLLSDVPKFSIVNPCFFEVVGLLDIEGNPDYENSKGLRLFRVDSAIVNVKVENTCSVGVGVADCFKPVLHVDICGNDGNGITTPGLGYGLSVSRSTMYGLFSGNSFGAKHAFTTSANVSFPGVSWGNRITNFTGSNSLQNGIFDSHASTGSVYFSNCIAIGYGAFNSESDLIKYPSGFSVEAAFTSIDNCRVYNCSSGVSCTNAKEIITLIVSNLIVNNCNSAFAANGSGTNPGCNIKNLSINNIQMINDVDISGSAIFRIGLTEIENLNISNLNGIGVGSAIRIGGSCLLPGLIAVNIETKLYSPELYDTTEAIDNPFFRLGSNLNYIILLNCTTNAPQLFYTTSSAFIIPEISLINFISNYGLNYHLYLRNKIENLILKDCKFKDLLSTSGYSVFCHSSSEVSNITIKDCEFEGVNNRGVFISPSAIDYQLIDIDNECNNIDNKLLWSASKLPSKWITKGSFSNPERIIGTATPEGAINAPFGCVYVDTSDAFKYYFKTSDNTSNLGWKVVTLT